MGVVMEKKAERFKLRSWHRWVLSVCAVLFLIYLSLSWFYLPGKLKRVTEVNVSEMIGREITVENIHFNPFEISLTVMALSVSDTEDGPLVAWDNLLVDFGFWRSIFSWEIALSEVALDNPRIKIVKLEEGFNFSDIIETLSSSDSGSDPERDEPDGGGSIAIEIFNTSINNGTFEYMDRSGAIPAGTTLDDVSILVKKLYFATGDENLNPFSINARSQRGGEIELKGNYRIDPLYMEGTLGVKGVDLQALSGFLENSVPLKIRSGMLSLDTDILVKEDRDFILRTDKGNISIDDFILDDSVPEPPMMSAGQINIQDVSFDLNGKQVMVEKVLLDNITLNQWIDEAGRARYENLLSGKDQKEAIEKDVPAEEPVNTEAVWDIAATQFSLKDSTINFDDHNQNIERGHSLTGISLDLRDISLAPGSRIPFRLAALLDESGGITAEGSLSPSPFSMELDYHLDNILLNLFSDYIEAASWLSLKSGRLSVGGKVSAETDEKTFISVSADLDVDNFELEDTRSGDPLFGFESFRVDDIRAEVDKQTVRVASVSISKPDINLNLSEEKEFNLSGLMKEKQAGTVSEVSPETSASSPGWKFEIEKAGLSEGTLLFSDQSVRPAYKTGLYNMTFSMDRFGSSAKAPTPFSFKTNIDKYAPFTIAGSLDPMDRQPGFAFQSALKELEMSHLSPYSGVYIGNNLKSGKLSLNLDYTLHDRELKGKNNINAKNLYLGEKLSGEPVINAPVGLGLALLRDLSGVIDLDVGISGDLDDPGFSVSGIIVKTLVNIIVKAAASPFKLLGALIPGGGEDIGNITFDPGDFVLNQKSKDSLKDLVGALNKRPQLIVSVKGNASDPDDLEVLKMMHLKQVVAEKRAMTLPVIEQETQDRDLWMIGENRPVLENINKDMGLPAVSERMAEMLSSGNADNQDGTGSRDGLNTEQKVYKQIYDDILSAWKIEPEELLGLAEERALSIKQYLVEDLALTPERVSIIKAGSADLSGRTIELGVDVL